MNKKQKSLVVSDLKVLRDHILRYCPPPRQQQQQQQGQPAMTSSASSSFTSYCSSPLLVGTATTAAVHKKNRQEEVVFPYSVLLSRINKEIKIATAQQSDIQNSRSIVSKKKKKKKKKTNNGKTTTNYLLRMIKTMLRIFFMDVPMVMVFSLVMLTMVVKFYYNHYISPTIDAAQWIQDDASRLQDEFTYYARECDVSDVTTGSIQDVILQQQQEHDTSGNGKNNYDEAVQVIMTHGMAVVPSLIDTNTSQELRNYILKRNMELTADEVIPLDTPQNRWSFGIHANEHVSVANALSQLSSNVLLENILSKLLGHDPAVAEITAISVAPGAEAQGWHSDVKQLGNSVKYAQTFTHSYSLFLPLQDVTNVMGATELCPGTHYCADEDLEDVCVEKGFQAAADGGIWKAGDGLLMNQKMWHRGAAYTAKNGPHRVVFIITFISRPNFGVDHRQLSHGTYFHIHPHMYGHTWNDLKNAHVVMTWPFAPLRSLGIWKPPNANWGWDWVTTSATRIANDQNGYMFEDLLDFVESYSIGQMIPSWLHGSTAEEGGWQLYFKETIENIALFAVVIYVLLFLLLMSVTLVMDLFEEFDKHRTKSYIQRTLCWNVLVLVLTHQVVMKLESTQYARSVREKTIFARPFVAKSDTTSNEHLFEDIVPITIGRNVTITERLTTIPEKHDVLLGSRFASNEIGYYRHFLNYHPGNRMWRDLITTYSELYRSYCRLPLIFQSYIRSTIENDVHQNGRILTQNYYGEWVVMNDEDVKDTVLRNLQIGIDTIHQVLDKEIDVLTATARHGTFMRGSPLIQIATLKNLGDLKNILKPEQLCSGQSIVKGHNGSFRRRNILDSSSSFPIVRYASQSSPLRHRSKEKRSFLPHNSRTGMHPKVGDVILANFRGSGYMMPCKILFVEYDDYAVAEFKYGISQDEYGGVERSNVYLNKTKPFKGVKQNDRIAVLNHECQNCPITFEDATLGTCYPDLTCEAVDIHGQLKSVFKDEFVLAS